MVTKSETPYIQRYRAARKREADERILEIILADQPDAAYEAERERFREQVTQATLTRSVHYELDETTLELIHGKLTLERASLHHVPPVSQWLQFDPSLEVRSSADQTFTPMRAVFFVKLADREAINAATAHKGINLEQTLHASEHLWTLYLLDDSNDLRPYVDLRYHAKMDHWFYPPHLHPCHHCIKEIQPNGEPFIIACENCTQVALYWSCWMGTTLAMLQGAMRDIEVVRHSPSSRGRKKLQKNTETITTIHATLRTRFIPTDLPPSQPPEPEDADTKGWVQEARERGVLVEDVRPFEPSTRTLSLYDQYGQRTRWRPGPDGKSRTIDVSAFKRVVRMRNDRIHRVKE